jgi:hypothetical protein
MKNLILFSFLIVFFSCEKTSVESSDSQLQAELSKINDVSIFADVLAVSGQGTLDITLPKTIFIPTNEAFKYYEIANDRKYDKATIIAFLASQMIDTALPSSSFKSGKQAISNGNYIRVYDGRTFTQIEESLVEAVDLKVGNLTVHLVDRFFAPEILLGHDHSMHSSGHSHGGTHTENHVSNCGTTGPDANTLNEQVTFRSKTSTFLATLPTWGLNSPANRNMPHDFALMGGKNNALPYVHYFSRKNMEDGKFMDPNAPEGLMYGYTADGTVYPISAIYMTREATAAQLHNLNCMYMFHEHDGLPGVMLHFFHDKYPSTNYGLDHEADPVLVRKMTLK